MVNRIDGGVGPAPRTRGTSARETTGAATDTVTDLTLGAADRGRAGDGAPAATRFDGLADR
jgi:hypothetical protein